MSAAGIPLMLWFRLIFFRLIHHEAIHEEYKMDVATYAFNCCRSCSGSPLDAPLLPEKGV
jgi:hypothetical protein